jgi:NAD-dependent dihydropyrimidine dehydrogenase PreA subunit
MLRVLRRMGASWVPAGPPALLCGPCVQMCPHDDVILDNTDMTLFDCRILISWLLVHVKTSGSSPRGSVSCVVRGLHFLDLRAGIMHPFVNCNGRNCP